MLVAGLVAAGVAPKSMDSRITGIAGSLAALLVILAVCWFLYQSGISREKREDRTPAP